MQHDVVSMGSKVGFAWTVTHTTFRPGRLEFLSFLKPSVTSHFLHLILFLRVFVRLVVHTLFFLLIFLIELLSRYYGFTMNLLLLIWMLRKHTDFIVSALGRLLSKGHSKWLSLLHSDC